MSRRAGRLGQVLVGLVLLLAGAAKVWDPLVFYWQVVAKVEPLGLGNPSNTLARLAMSLGAVECGLGLALILDWLPRRTVPAAMLLMTGFVGLAALSVSRGDEGNCGCFGSLVERAPREALVENVVLLGLLALAWAGRRGIEPALAPARRWIVVSGLALAGMVTVARVASQLDQVDDSDLREGVPVAGLSFPGTDVDPERGTYLLVVFSPTCSHCIAAVPRVNEWSDADGLPDVVAVTMQPQDSDALTGFRREQGPRYPTVTVSTTDFYRLTNENPIPRVALVREGVIRRVWEGSALPTVEQVREAVE